MFMVDNDTVIAVQTAYHAEGTVAAVAALRRKFHISDDRAAADCVDSIIRWVVTEEAPPRPKTRRRRTATA